ncbi:hypothetical protein BsWGS_19826 [Bradybaena similaris]
MLNITQSSLNKTTDLFSGPPFSPNNRPFRLPIQSKQQTFQTAHSVQTTDLSGFPFSPNNRHFRLPIQSKQQTSQTAHSVQTTDLSDCPFSPKNRPLRLPIQSNFSINKEVVTPLAAHHSKYTPY